MDVYLDSTIVIRQLLGTGNRWEGWGKWEKAYASMLLRTECNQAANRMRAAGKIDDVQRARLGTWIETVCSSIVLIPVTEGVLRRAGEPLPADPGILRSIHLATMLELQAAHGVTCAIATDDDALVRAAASLGFENALTVPVPEPTPVAEPSATPAAEPAAEEAPAEKTT